MGKVQGMRIRLFTQEAVKYPNACYPGYKPAKNFLTKRKVAGLSGSMLSTSSTNIGTGTYYGGRSILDKVILFINI